MARTMQELTDSLKKAKDIIYKNPHYNDGKVLTNTVNNNNRPIQESVPSMPTNSVPTNSSIGITEDKIRVAQERMNLPKELLDSFLGTSTEQDIQKAAQASLGVTEDMFKEVNPDGFGQVSQDVLLEQRLKQRNVQGQQVQQISQNNESIVNYSNTKDTDIRRIIREEIDYMKSTLIKEMSKCFINEEMEFDKQEDMKFIKDGYLYEAKIYSKSKINLKKK